MRVCMPNQRLFYCALDCPGAQDDPCPPGGYALPHISHWGFKRGIHCGSGGGAITAGVEGRTGHAVEHAIGKKERTARFARSSLAAMERSRGVRRQARSVALSYVAM